jgi:hypothetical protein
MKAIEAAKLVAFLAAAYRDSKFTEDASKVYEALLADLDFATAQEAVVRLISTSKWLPTIAEIRATAADIKHGPVRSGGEAYGDVLAEIRRTGAWGAPSFKDPLVAECVRLMTWRGLCLGENEASDRARFIELYDNLAARERGNVVAGRALPAPTAGLALPLWKPLQLPEPKPSAAVTAAELDALLAKREPVASPYAGRRMTADEINAALERAS